MKNSILTRLLLLLTALLPALPTTAATPLDSLQLWARLGYSVGAAAPLGIPATIRSLERFQPTASVVAGVGVRLPLHDRWGVQSGLHLENKGMDVAISTKGYHMAMVKGGEELEGVYTGRVEQQTTAWMLTLPVMATIDVSARCRLHAGPYASLLLKKRFRGNVSDGYLRKDDPTGAKIEMGHAMDERATYDFSADMRRWQAGLAAGADWLLGRRLLLSADLSWGLTGLMHSSFKTVEQTLYPIYGTLSVAYRIK